MSSKRRQKQLLAAKKQAQKQHKPGARLQEAQQAFAKGDLAQAQQLAEAALNAANDPNTKQNTQTLLAEIYLRRTAQSVALPERLALLGKATQLQPNQPRLHYHLGLAQWRAGDPKAALAAFARTAKGDPSRPGITFLGQLAALRSGQPWRPAGLTPAEVNTLELLQRLQQGAKPNDLLASLDNKPLLGKQAEAWALLLQMQANSQSAPLVSWQKVTEADPHSAANALLHYYQGVAAMRKGEVTLAMSAWQQAAAKLTTPWLIENLFTVRREEAAALAQEQQWQAIVDLFTQTRREVGEADLDPGLVEIAGLAHFHLGYAAAEAQQWPVALTHFRAASDFSPSRQVSQNLALAEEEAGNWLLAATCWREMIRRRPRKADHPDALSDAQVAAIWARAAHCYFVTEDLNETITCLKNAVKYAPTNLALRISLVEMLMNIDSTEAATNELDRILEVDANYVPALTRLGVLLMDNWERDPLPIWRRVLAQDPQNHEARQAVATLYVQRATDDFQYQHYYRGRLTPAKEIATLQAGLQEVPNHPVLLIALAMTYAEQKKPELARTHLLQAAQAAPKDVQVLNKVLHELLHVEGGAQVEELMPQMRQIGGLRPGFWIDQGEQVLNCKLGANWAEFFWDEAARAAEKSRGEDSLPTTLLKIFQIALLQKEKKTAQKYEQRLRKEYANAGAVEFVEAVHAYALHPDKNVKVVNLLNSAKNKAQKANEPGIATLAQDFIAFIQRPRLPDFLNFGFGGLDPDDFDPDELDPGTLLEILANLNKGELDALRRFL